LFNHVYVEAFLTILMIEKTFGTQLREHAIRISRERHQATREAQEYMGMNSLPEKTGPHP